MNLLAGIGAVLLGWWLTPDQQGALLFARGDYVAAAERFSDPMWQGAAWYRAGDFKRAAASFGRAEGAAAAFDEGNAWLMQGEYLRAIRCYDSALAERPDWTEAKENRALAVLRAARLERTGEDAGDQRVGADAIVFDREAGRDGQSTDIDGSSSPAEEQIQALWLRRVQTRPADFLRVKFALQDAAGQGGSP